MNILKRSENFHSLSHLVFTITRGGREVLLSCAKRKVRFKEGKCPTRSQNELAANLIHCPRVIWSPPPAYFPEGIPVFYLTEMWSCCEKRLSVQLWDRSLEVSVGSTDLLFPLWWELWQLPDFHFYLDLQWAQELHQVENRLKTLLMPRQSYRTKSRARMSWKALCSPMCLLV